MCASLCHRLLLRDCAEKVQGAELLLAAAGPELKLDDNERNVLIDKARAPRTTQPIALLELCVAMEPVLVRCVCLVLWSCCLD